MIVYEQVALVVLEAVVALEGVQEAQEEEEAQEGLEGEPGEQVELEEAQVVVALEAQVAGQVPLLEVIIYLMIKREF